MKIDPIDKRQYSLSQTLLVFTALALFVSAVFEVQNQQGIIAGFWNVAIGLLLVTAAFQNSAKASLVLVVLIAVLMMARLILVLKLGMNISAVKTNLILFLMTSLSAIAMYSQIPTKVRR